MFAEFDDTLTDDGRMEAPVLDALFRLRRAGLLVVPITGRPAGVGLDHAGIDGEPFAADQTRFHAAADTFFKHRARVTASSSPISRE